MAETVKKKTSTKTGTTKTATAKKATTRRTTKKSATTAVQEEIARIEEVSAPVASGEKKKILFVASEATPFIQTGGLAEVIGSLSTALAATGKFDVRVVIPLSRKSVRTSRLA